MMRLRRMLWLLPLLLGMGSMRAASPAEKRAFDVAAGAFKLNSSSGWAYAETNFDQFVQKYPESDLVPEAVLFQAQSRFFLRQYDSAISLLLAHRDKAGSRQDQYYYWIAEAQLAGGKVAEAAASFAQLAVKFPGSTNRFAAGVREAEARTRLEQWPQVIGLLQNPDGAFQQAVRAGAAGDLASSGYLILGEAQLLQKDLAGAQASLGWLAGQNLSPLSAWRRSYLKCRVQLAQGQVASARPTADDMVALAELTKEPALRSESIAVQADILERLGQLDEAIAAYNKNLVPGMAESNQRRSLLKIAELNLRKNRITEAAQTLELFLKQPTNTTAVDTALLTLGELRLKQFAEDELATNRLAEAEQCFDKLLAGFAQSPLVGKAWLDKGWCAWTRGRDVEPEQAKRGRYVEAEQAFATAAGRLAFSEDQAVARFKWADSQFTLRNFSGALTNYARLVQDLAARTELKAPLLEPALYQTVRAALEAGDLGAATNALGKILAWYPQGFAGDSCLLLTGQGFSRNHDPTRARELFARFQEMYPSNALSFEVKLAVARSFERQSNFMAAITNYDGWLGSFTNHPEQPEVEFRRASDYYQAGRETNAFELFTNFVARYPVHPRALQAQWWIGDHFFGEGNFIEAERNYRLVFDSTNWPPSDLTYQAQMMAGQAAFARQSYEAATNYFSKLAGNTNCPVALRFKATFACGDAVRSRTDPGDATNHQADLLEAINWFSAITEKFQTNELAPAAWGKIGGCYLELAAYTTNHFYDSASNAYRQVLMLPQASVAVRSEAKVGLGQVAGKLAHFKAAAEQVQLRQQALDDYIDVFSGRDLRDGEVHDLFWVRAAGLEAFKLASQEMNDSPQALTLGTNLAQQFPELRAAFEAKMQKLREPAKVP